MRQCVQLWTNQCRHEFNRIVSLYVTPILLCTDGCLSPCKTMCLFWTNSLIAQIKEKKKSSKYLQFYAWQKKPNIFASLKTVLCFEWKVLTGKLLDYLNVEKQTDPYERAQFKKDLHNLPLKKAHLFLWYLESQK